MNLFAMKMRVRTIQSYPLAHMSDEFDEVFMDNELSSFTYMALKGHGLQVGQLVQIEFSAALKQVRPIDL